MEWEKKLEEMNNILANHVFFGYEAGNTMLITDMVANEKMTKEKISSVTMASKNRLFKEEPSSIEGDVIEILKKKLDSDQFYNIFLLTTPNHLLNHYYIPIQERLYEYEMYKVDNDDNSYLFYNSDTGDNLGVGLITTREAYKYLKGIEDEIASMFGQYDRKRTANINYKYAEYTKELFIIGDQIRTKYILRDLLYDEEDNDEEEDSQENIENEVITPINWIWLFQISYKTLSILLDP